MPRETQSLFALNRGVVSHLGLARADVKRIALAAEDQTNWIPRVLGPMSIRPGFAYLGTTQANAAARYVKFIFATDDTALLEFTDSTMRVWISDALLTRESVASTIPDISAWTVGALDDAGAVSSYVAPYLQFVGTGTARAIVQQKVTCATPNVEHALRIIVARGPVMLRIGSTSGEDDYVKETTLYTGTHSIALTPAGDFYVRFFSTTTQKVWISSCTVEAAGVVTLPTPWTSSDLSHIRTDQSADVVFAACAGHQQRRIERRGDRPGGRSWSVALYMPSDGPFGLQNTGPTTITASAITGNVTLTASIPLWKSTHVGALFAMTSTGQVSTATASTSGVATPSIRVTGLSADNARNFTVTIAGDASGSLVNLQRSYDDATWVDVGGTYYYTGDGAWTVIDGLDNQIVYYRLRLTTRVAPDTVTMTLQIASGSKRGIVRITDFTSSTSVGAEVLSPLGGTDAEAVWEEGQWSDLKGWPTSVRIHEGRMWWGGQNGIWGSVSDAYDSFDATYLGNAAPINRTVGSGPVDTINWLLSLKGLLLGAQGAEYTARASSLDEAITPTNFNLKTSSTQGSGAVDALKVDQFGYYVNRAASKVFELGFDLRSYDYNSTDLMAVAPELGLPGIVRMDCQRLPDTRLHCVKSDGTAIVCVISRAEEVIAWIPVTTSGYIEDVVVLPAISGNLDDQVYYVVRRTINGSTVRYLEKWAQEIDCRGDQSLCYLADAHVSYSGAATTAITGLSHLEGESVVVWADGVDVGTDDTELPWTQTYTVSAGQITLAAVASNVVVGLPYTAKFKSAKLGLLNQETPLNQQKRVVHIGLILASTHPRGLRFGPGYDDYANQLFMDDMPLIEDGWTLGSTPHTDYDQNLIEFPGTWTTDARVCLQAQAPRPCTVLAVTLDERRHV